MLFLKFDRGTLLFPKTTRDVGTPPPIKAPNRLLPTPLDRLSSRSVLTDCSCVLSEWPLLANLEICILWQEFSLYLVAKTPWLVGDMLVNSGDILP